MSSMREYANHVILVVFAEYVLACAERCQRINCHLSYRRRSLVFSTEVGIVSRQRSRQPRMNQYIRVRFTDVGCAQKLAGPNIDG